ncbi:MAG TPA: metal-dependent hydrolase [Alphaproteobacteria bacterium]|nr:metal-dependent hydrolase [Alphaproteobacteria bacterium]
MIPRNPKLSFEDALPHWAPNAAFAQIVNAGSTSLPAVETYLNKVMARAAQFVDDRTLKQDIALFTAQEGNHYRQHRLFNKLLYGTYPGVRALEEQLGRDYDRQLAEKSLAFNVAYCEGFESLGIIHAEFFFEHVDDLLAGSDERLVKLWKWHLAEEFEHRTVCFDVHHALGSGYFVRIRGYLAAMRHLGRYGKNVSDYLLSVDRARMTPDERRHSTGLEKRYRRRFNRFALPKLLSVFSPFYNPRSRRAPRGSVELLQGIAAGSLAT